MTTPLLHLGLLVRDQRRSPRFYATYFGFDEARARRYPDGTVIVRNPQGFDLALHPGDPPERLPAFVHFGFQLPDADAVRALLARMDADDVPILERWDEPSYVAFKCLDPDGWRGGGLLGAGQLTGLSRAAGSSRGGSLVVPPRRGWRNLAGRCWLTDPNCNRLPRTNSALSQPRPAGLIAWPTSFAPLVALGMSGCGARS